jgi:hypothetical protein
LVKTPFQQSWQFRVEIEGFTGDIDIYVKDISYGPIEIETEAEKAGMHTLTYPSGTAPVGISMTMRDNQDQRVYTFAKAWCKKIVNEDGTVNLPPDYTKNWKRYSIGADSSETLRDEWKVFLTQVGDITESKEEPGFLEFPVTLIQFKS